MGLYWAVPSSHQVPLPRSEAGKLPHLLVLYDQFTQPGRESMAILREEGEDEGEGKRIEEGSTRRMRTEGSCSLDQHGAPSGCVDELWTFCVYCHDANPGSELVLRKMDKDFICFFNLLALAQKLGYRGCDYLYYKKRGSVEQGMCNLLPIESDFDVCEMVKQYADVKKVSLCFMKNKASEPHISPVKCHNDIPICEAVEEEEEEEDIYTESDDSLSESSDSGSIDEAQAEVERKELKKQWAEMKKKNADPTEHCEGDTDVEDLFEDPFPTQEIGDKGKAMVDKNKEINSKKRKSVISGFAPSSDGAMKDDDILCSEDDDGAVKDLHARPGKKRRPRKRQVRMWFNASNILDSSQFCDGLCFINMDQLRLALQSYHIVNGRDYRFIRNEPGYVVVKCQSELCPFYLRASTISKEPTVIIRKLEEPHTCGTTNLTSRITSTWIAKVFEEQIRSDPDWKIQGLIEDIDPPKFTKHPGRPKKNRRKSADEQTVTGGVRLETVTCRNCDTQGHNYLGCGKKLKPELRVKKQLHLAKQEARKEARKQAKEQAEGGASSQPCTQASSATGGSGMSHGHEPSDFNMPFSLGTERGRAAGATPGHMARATGTGRGRGRRLEWLLFGQE